MSDKTLCKSCDGAGTVPTGIEESPEASCRRCNGDGYEPASSPAMNAASPTEAPALNGIKATLRHDEGAIARCSYCRRYSLDPATLSDRQPVCDCGKANGWSGSFVRPDADSIWSGKVPSAAPVDQGSSPEHDLLNQRWSKEADMIESWKGKGSATSGGGSPTVSTFGAMDISDLDQARGVITRLRQRLYDIAQEQPRAALAASAEQSNNQGAALDEYGETDFGFTFAGIQLEAGDKRLASLIVRALGTAHPAMDDLTALLFRARSTPVSKRAAAPASVPREWISEIVGPEVDDLSYGQGYRRGWNDCRAKVLAAPEVAQPAAQGESIESEQFWYELSMVRLQKNAHHQVRRAESHLVPFINAWGKSLATPAPTAGEPSATETNFCLLIDELLMSWLSTKGDSPENRERRINARSALEVAIKATQGGKEGGNG